MSWGRRSPGLVYTDPPGVMESRLKERLTGAAILVAVIVLVVPEIFHDRRSAPSTTAAATPAPQVPPTSPAAPVASTSPGAGVPTRSYTIDLAREAPQSSAASRTSEPSTPATPAPSHHSGATSRVPPPVAEEPAPAREAHSATQSEHSPAAHSQAHGAGGWVVQLGLFAKQANAERLAHSAQSHGFDVAVSRYGARSLYRVAVAGVPNRAAAEQLSQRLHGAGLPAAILGPR